MPFSSSTRFRAVVAAGFWLSLAATAWFTLTPQPPPLHPIPFLDKIQHFSVFCLLMTLALLSLLRQPALRLGLMLAAFGGAIEVAQGFVSRDPSVFDFVADSAGVLSGWLIVSALTRAGVDLRKSAG